MMSLDCSPYICIIWSSNIIQMVFDLGTENKALSEQDKSVDYVALGNFSNKY